MSWTINQRALRRAYDKLSLRQPLEVEIKPMRDGLHGQMQSAGGRHRMALNSRKADCCAYHRSMPVMESARDTVLHELRHAWQHERRPRDHHRLYAECSRIYGYRDNPFEVDAREWARENAAEFRDLIEAC